MESPLKNPLINTKNLLNYTKYLLAFVSVLLILISGFSSDAEGASASLYLSPSAGTYTVGNTFSIQIKVNSGGVAINTSEGTLIFNPDKLEVKSISKTESIFSLWVQEPTFSNSLGTINFAGGKPTPGFTGAAGTIITITFQAKTATIEPATVTFTSSSVLADDGKGTNILANMGSGSYKLIARVITPISPEEEYLPPTVPGVPVVSSKTHPDENKWYSNNDPEFTWTLPSDVNGVSIYFSQSPTSNPGSLSEGLFSLKSYEDVDDGIWYFHIKFRNQYGWGEILHRKVLIDTGSPEPFEIKIQRENSTDPQPVLIFETIDETSGIEYYEMKIDEGDTFLASTPYKMSSQAPGEHIIVVKAVDRAGNFRSEKITLTIAPRVLGVLFGEEESNRLLINFIIALSTIIGILILVIFYQWYRFSMERKRLRKETREVDENVRGAFRALREEVQEQIEYLDKKPGLTKEEKEIRDKLQEALDISEKFIGKEIKDVEKELE